MSVIDFTLWGILARWSFLFVAPGIASLRHPPPIHPCFISAPPLLALLQTMMANQALTFTAVFHVTTEQEVNKAQIDIYAYKDQQKRVLVRGDSCSKTFKPLV